MSRNEPTGEMTEPVEVQAQDETRAAAADSQLRAARAEQSRKHYEFQLKMYQLQNTEEKLKNSKISLREKETELRFQLRKHEAELNHVMANIHTLKEYLKIFAKRNKRFTAERARFERFCMKVYKEIENVIQQIDELDCRGDDAASYEDQVVFLIEKTEAQIKRFETKMHNLDEGKRFLHRQRARVAAEVTKLKRQIDKLKEKSLEFVETKQNIQNQREEVEHQIMKNENKIKKLNRLIADNLDQINDLNKDRETKSQKTQDLKKQPSLLQQEKILADSEEMMNPVEETPPNSGSWFSSAKSLLKVGLGVVVGGLLVSSALWALSAL